MTSKTKPTRQRAGGGSSAARKPAAAKKTTARENPFKKAADGIHGTTNAAANAFSKSSDAANDAAKSTTRQAGRTAANATEKLQQGAFAYGTQFNQANDWMRGQTESFQNIWQQALQGMPAMASMGASAFGKQDGARNGAAAAFGKANPMFAMDASKFAQAGDKASRSVQEIMSLGSEHMQTISECATATAGVAKDMSQEILQTANSLFSDHVELTKAALACRNMDDMMELQGKASRLAVETVFNESLRLSELAFKYAVDVAEPLQQRFAQMGERLTKITGSNAA